MMRHVQEWWRWLKAGARRSAMDDALDEELKFHLAMKARDTGSNTSARRAVGSSLLWRERSRDAWGWAWADDLWWDLRYALRLFAQNRGFAAVAVAMLALGIGINTMVFSITNTVLFKGFPLVKANDRLLYLTEGEGCCVSYPNFEDWRAQARSFGDMALVHGAQQSYSDETGYPETLYTTEVTPNTFRLVGQKPVIGRDFSGADAQPGAAPVAILRYGVWERRYGKNPSVLGKSVQINGTLTTIIGVMPAGFSFPQNQDLWLPLVPTPEVRQRANRNTWFAFGRLKPGVSEKTARAEMATIFKRMAEAYPENRGARQNPHVYTFAEFFIGDNAATIYRALWAAVAFVLLITCANLANLLLGRAMGRGREISVCVALGAGRWRIVRQLLIESLLLSLAGGFFSFWIARSGIKMYARWANGPGISDAINGVWFNNMLDYAMDIRTLAYLAAISIGTGLLFGLAPASRLGKLDVNGTLKDGGRGATGGERGRRLSSLLVTVEMTLAVVLLAGAGVLVRSFLKVYLADFGFQSRGIIMANIGLPPDRYKERSQQVAFFEELTRRLEAVPGIQAAGLSGYRPGSGSTTFPYELFSSSADAAGEPEQNLPRLGVVATGPGYFRALGQPLVAGRDIDRTDVSSSEAVVIVNQRFAQKNWPGQDPLGQRFRIYRGGKPGDWVRVIGIAPDVAQNSALEPELNVVVYFPYWRAPAAFLGVVVRTRLPLGQFTDTLRREMRAMDPVLPIALGPFDLDELMAERYKYRGVSATMFLLIATIALLLASIGLYAVIAHSVGQRKQEIGVRLALGATGADIAGLVMRQGMTPVLIGLGAGLAGSLLVNRLLQTQLVQISPSDPLTLSIVAVALLAAGAFGCLIPVRRAVQVDPVVTLRQD